MRLLLAEDEKSLARAVSVILTKNNYEVDVVGDGGAALDYLTSGEYDGAILDIMMPVMDGLEVLRALRRQGSSLPVLLLTARSEIEDKVEGLDSGANDYLTKPFAAPELLARIRAMTRSVTPQTSAVLKYGDLELDQGSFLLRGPQGSQTLVGHEYQILELFLLHPRQYLSAEQLFERIWGYESESDVNVVWVNISNLRKKLSAVGSAVSIRAKRGVGYSLEDG